ncbi:MAG: GTPase Era [Eubacteriaceae bacterium]|nr:GTPase Era [Eubacteriaceae bacterium]
MNNKDDFKSGFVAIVGRTNVGKSTIINSLLNEKLVIMSDKPQTTRNNIRCIYTDEEAQIIFVDTPGVHRAKNKLSGMMTEMVSGSLLNTDMVVYVVEDDMHIGKTDQIILTKLKEINKPVIVLINKADKLSQDEVLFKINLFKDYNFINDIIPISALTGKNMELIIPYIKKYLNKGPMYFPQDMITDKPEKFFISELIREKALNLLQQEIPHGIAVEILSMKERRGRDLIDIEATIYCERKSHKSIIIGKNGSMIKNIGTKAREDIENFLDTKVNLQLWVKVKEEWRDNNSVLKDLGYKDEVY